MFRRKLKKGKPTGKPILSGFTLNFDDAFQLGGCGQLPTRNRHDQEGQEEDHSEILHPITNFTVMYVAASD